MSSLKAIIFDVDGTLANTERDGHRVAFNLAFASNNLNWNWNINLYEKLLKITGGKERIKHFIEEKNIKINGNIREFCKKIHKEKTDIYLNLLKTNKVNLRKGVKELLKQAIDEGIKIAIATTTTPENVTVLLESQLGKESVSWFEVIGAGDIVPNKKPAPDIYNYVLKKLNLNPKNCVAIEDSDNGLIAAKSSNLRTLIITNDYTKNHNFYDADLVVNKYGNKNNHFTTKQGDNFGFEFVNIDLLKKICDFR